MREDMKDLSLMLGSEHIAEGQLTLIIRRDNLFQAQTRSLQEPAALLS